MSAARTDWRWVMSDKQIDIGVELGKGWELFKPNMGLVIVASLIGMLVSVVTCGILAGPMSAGMFLIVMRLIQKDPTTPQAGDVFKGFDFFVQALLVMVIGFVASMAVGFVLAFIPFLGRLVSMVVSLAISSLIMWSLMFVVYQKLSAIDAIKKVVTDLMSGSFTMPFIFGVVASLISSLGALACGVGIFFTVPLSYCCFASLYDTLYGDKIEEAKVVEPEVMPPASDLRL